MYILFTPSKVKFHSAFLVAVEEARDQEQHRQHEGELGVRSRVDVKLDYSVP
jgi:hypothetical protein